MPPAVLTTAAFNFILSRCYQSAPTEPSKKIFEAIECPHCKHETKTDKTIKLADIKSVTCAKCRCIFSLGEGRAKFKTGPSGKFSEADILSILGTASIEQPKSQRELPQMPPVPGGRVPLNVANSTPGESPTSTEERKH